MQQSGVGGGPGGLFDEPPRQVAAGADDPPAGGRRIPGVPGEPRLSGLAGGGDPHRHERGGDVGGDRPGARTRRSGARRPGRRRVGGTSLPALLPGRGPGRRVGSRAWERAVPKVWRKAGRRWCARCSCRGASRFRKGFRPTCPDSPKRRRPSSSRPPSPATANGTSAHASAARRFPSPAPHDDQGGRDRGKPLLKPSIFSKGDGFEPVDRSNARRIRDRRDPHRIARLEAVQGMAAVDENRSPDHPGSACRTAKEPCEKPLGIGPAHVYRPSSGVSRTARGLMDRPYRISRAWDARYARDCPKRASNGGRQEKSEADASGPR